MPVLILFSNALSVTELMYCQNNWKMWFGYGYEKKSHSLCQKSNAHHPVLNNQSYISFPLNHVYHNSFPSTKFRCTTTREIEYIIRSLTLSNSCGYDEIQNYENYARITLALH
jgi:hypothetical protein